MNFNALPQRCRRCGVYREAQPSVCTVAESDDTADKCDAKRRESKHRIVRTR